MSKTEVQELRKSPREKRKEIENLQSGTSTTVVQYTYGLMIITSTICTVYSNMFINVGISTSTIIIYSV